MGPIAMTDVLLCLSFFWIDCGKVFNGVTGGMGMRRGCLGTHKRWLFSLSRQIKSHFYPSVHIFIRKQVADTNGHASLSLSGSPAVARNLDYN